MKLAGNVECIREMRNLLNILVGLFQNEYATWQTGIHGRKLLKNKPKKCDATEWIEFSRLQVGSNGRIFSTRL
jgi:hypothetical protein